MIQQIDKIKYGTITIPYQVIKTRRSKTSEVIVDADTVTVRAPMDKDKKELQKIVLDKASWILKKQREYRDTILQISKPSFKEHTTLPYLGKNYPLAIDKNQEINTIEMVDGKFVVRLKLVRPSSNMIRRLYEEWITEKAHNIFSYKVKRYSKRLGVKPKQIAVKNLRNRWGSLDKRSIINLNVNLVKAPEDVIDYIILHELCHLKIKQHSHHYWDLLHKFMPNYQEKIKWLKANGDNLM
jgi:predicted metal-dependent hydrolase